MNIVTYHKEEDCQLQKFWEIESTGIEADMYKNSTLKQYQENCISYTGSRYLAKLPWKNEYELPSNENAAKRRTDSTIRRISKDQEIFNTYRDIIADQENRGFIEKVPEDEIHTNRKVHYIPHHPVKKDSVTTPIRIVYDCSLRESKTSPSLNDCLDSTPPELNKITDLDNTSMESPRILKRRFFKYNSPKKTTTLPDFIG